MIKKSNDQLTLWDYFLFPNSTKTGNILQEISDILDSHPWILEKVWESLNRRRALAEEEAFPEEIGKKEPNRKSPLTAEQILRIYMAL